MGFILENKMPDGVRADGWYGGQNKKYHDMFDLTSKKEYAYVFENEDDAQKKANALNKGGWKFVVLAV